VPSPVREEAAKPTILVNPGCFMASEIAAAATAVDAEVMLDPSIPGDVAVPGGIGVKVINMNDAGVYDAVLAREELPGVVRPVIAVCPGEVGATDHTILKLLTQELTRDGIDMWECKTVNDILSRVIAACAGA
jgi:hypothetical protein